MSKSFKKLLSLTFCVFYVPLFVSEAYSESLVETSVVETTSLNKQLDHLVNLVDDNVDYQFAQSLEDSISRLKSLGYTSAATHSLKLIEKVSTNQFSTTDRLVVLKAARELSPKHPEVLLNLVMFAGDFGLFQSLKYLSLGVLELPNHPIFFSEISARIILLLTFTMCLTLLVAVFGNLVFSSSEVISFLAGNFKKQSRLLISSVLMVFIYLLPLIVPLFLLLIFWSIVVAFGSSRMRFAPLVSSVLVLTFVSFLPYGLKTISFSQSTVGKAIDAIQTKDFIFNSEMLLRENEVQFANSQVLPILISQNQQMNRDVDKALVGYKTSLLKGIRDEGLFYFVQSNIAQIDFNRGEQELAFESWSKLYDDGWREYELLFNLSVASVSIYKKQEYEKYFSEFRNRFRAEDVNFSRNIKPIIARIPTSSIYAFTFSTIRSKSISISPNSEKIEKALFGGDAKLITYFSIFTLCWGFLLASKNQARYRYRVSIVADRSQLKLDQFSFIQHFPILHLFLVKREWTFFVLTSLILFTLMMLFNFVKSFSFTDPGLGIVILVGLSIFYLIAIGLRFQARRGVKC